MGIKLGTGMLQCKKCNACYQPSRVIVKENIDGLIQEVLKENLRCPICGLINEKVTEPTGKRLFND